MPTGDKLRVYLVDFQKENCTRIYDAYIFIYESLKTFLISIILYGNLHSCKNYRLYRPTSIVFSGVISSGTYLADGHWTILLLSTGCPTLIEHSLNIPTSALAIALCAFSVSTT